MFLVLGEMKFQKHSLATVQSGLYQLQEQSLVQRKKVRIGAAEHYNAPYKNPFFTHHIQFLLPNKASIKELISFILEY